MPSGSVDENFQANIAAMIAAGSAVAAATTNAALRAWMLGDLALWAGDPLDLADIINAFDRTEAGLQYGEALVSPLGATGDAASAKFQSDNLAVQERAFRLRHATGVRCALHAASRRAGHGNELGAPARVGIYAQDLLVAGGAGFKPRTTP